jgi:hypothetical protein
MMNKSRWLLPYACLVAASLMSGCGEDSKSKKASTPPEPVAEKPICIISADCPNGTHCDLGECVQSCNTELPCGEGSCSPRARCLTEDVPDADPVPTAEFKGTVAATSSVQMLTEADAELPFTLTSANDQPVNYRVQVEGPHLSIENPRGTFTGTANLVVKVDASKLGAADVPGWVRIFTDLGQVSVPADLHAGLSGTYRGELVYGDGHINLGKSRLRVSLSETSGEVLVWVDPDASLLFPDLSGTTDPATPNTTLTAVGGGSYDGKSLSLTITQSLPASFGGAGNHLARDIGRKLTLTLKPSGIGGWRGEFQEQISGLFVQPITQTGTVSLAFETRDGMSPLQAGSGFQAATVDNTEMTADITDSGWTLSCDGTLADSSVCGATWDASAANRAVCFNKVYNTHVIQLFSANGAEGTIDKAYADIANDCEASIAATALGDNAAAVATVGSVPVIDCGLAAAVSSSLDDNVARATNNFVEGAINPRLVVAQQKMMTALDASLSAGATLATETAAYDDASAVLDWVTRWIYQPAVLEHLLGMTPTQAMGTLGVNAPPYTTFPAANAISRLLRVSRDLQAERARLVAINNLDSVASRREAAQTSALLAYLEATALNALVTQWGNAPVTLGSESSQLLDSYDAAFGDAVAGVGLFGVPDSFVPFVYNADDPASGSSNFKQMLSLANKYVVQFKALESTYTAAAQASKSSDYQLATQAGAISQEFDLRLHQLCGNDFAIEAAAATGDVSACGGPESEVALQRLQISASGSQLQGALDQLKGMKDKIQIDMTTMQRKYQLHEENLQFLDFNGERINAVIMAQGMVQAMESALQTAAQGNLANGFTPAGMAVGVAALEMQKAGLNVARQELETAQQMHFERQAQAAEEIEAQANIEKQLIDLAQYRLQIEQSRYAQSTAELTVTISLGEAKRLLKLRTEALHTATLNPANDPSYRMVRDATAIKLLQARAQAQRYLFFATQALQYEVNESVPDASHAVLVARSGARMDALSSCLDTIPTSLTQPQGYTREVSVRAMLGITGPRTDDCTGEVLSEAQQFQRALLQNSSLDGKGGVSIKFATDLMPGNELWSTDVCTDRISGVRAQLVGDYLGDNEAEVNMTLSGAAIMRSCSDGSLTSWSLGGDSLAKLGTSVAVIQAGVNSFGDAPVNTSLFGQSVARAEWVLTIPGADAAPTNSDLDITKLEDIVLEIAHGARPLGGSSGLGLNTSCLSNVL